MRTATATIDDPEAVTQATQQMAHAAEDASKRRLRRKGQADSATPTRNQAVASVAAVGLAAQVEELKQMVSEYEETNKQLESRINELEAENRKLAAANRESEKKKKPKSLSLTTPIRLILTTAIKEVAPFLLLKKLFNNCVAL